MIRPTLFHTVGHRVALNLNYPRQWGVRFFLRMLEFGIGMRAFAFLQLPVNESGPGPAWSPPIIVGSAQSTTVAMRFADFVQRERCQLCKHLVASGKLEAMILCFLTLDLLQ